MGFIFFGWNCDGVVVLLECCCLCCIDIVEVCVECVVQRFYFED